MQRILMAFCGSVNIEIELNSLTKSSFERNHCQRHTGDSMYPASTDAVHLLLPNSVWCASNLLDSRINSSAVTLDPTSAWATRHPHQTKVQKAVLRIEWPASHPSVKRESTCMN
jgi:hypothetical protein